VRGDSGGNGEAGAGDEADASLGVGRDWLAARLGEKDAVVEFLVSYARRAPRPDAQVLALLQQASADGSVWLFSSSEAVNNLLSMVPGQSWGQAVAVATHPRIAQAARAAGFAVVCESRPDLADLVASIESLA
jgi:uroporphyrinogen-III synthase